MEVIKIGEINIVSEEDGGSVAYSFKQTIDDALQLDTNEDLYVKLMANVGELHSIICELLERME